MAKEVMTIEKKRAQLEVLERLFKELDSAEKEATMRYQKIGTEDEQARHWRTGELLWADEEKTIPQYNEIWDYVKIPQDEIGEHELAKEAAINELRAVLEKLI